MVLNIRAENEEQNAKNVLISNLNAYSFYRRKNAFFSKLTLYTEKNAS